MNHIGYKSWCNKIFNEADNIIFSIWGFYVSAKYLSKDGKRQNLYGTADNMEWIRINFLSTGIGDMHYFDLLPSEKQWYWAGFSDYIQHWDSFYDNYYSIESICDATWSTDNSLYSLYVGIANRVLYYSHVRGT